MQRVETDLSAGPSGARQHRDWGQSLWLVLAPVLARLTVAMLVAGLALSLFIKIAHGVVRGSTRQFDAGTIAFFQVHQVPVVHTLMNWVSLLAGPIFVPLLVLAVLVWHARIGRFWPDGWTMLIASAGGQLFVVGLKLLFHRPRPLEIYSYLSYSFPSSHSFMALTIYGLLAYWLTRDAPRQRAAVIWSVAALFIALVGFSRVFLGAHYPSDVLAGYAIGVPWLWGCVALPGTVHRQRHDVSPEEVRARYEEGRARLREATLFVPNLAKLAMRLARDSRVPMRCRVALFILGGYLLSPIDLIPDFIPVMGMVDDIVFATLTLRWVARSVPAEVVREHWDGTTDLTQLLENTRSGLLGLMNRA